MIFTKVAISLIVILLLFSIIMSNILHIIETDHNFYINSKNEGFNFTSSMGRKYKNIGDSPSNLVWFLQISDIHISIFRDPGRISQFQQFCDSTVRKIKPFLVLATGDLTDAKAKDNLGSSQVKMEWVYYHNIIKESGVTDNTVWLDIRGNHDNFNIRNINDKENYYRNYSIQGVKYPKSYVYYKEQNGLKLAFLGVDACPDPGLRRPFNFIGILDIEEQKNLIKLHSEALKNSDHIVWFGHYPTSCILSVSNDSQKFDLRELIGKSHQSQAYLCGHLHSMGGLVPDMYTKQKRGYLELELGDWKDNRRYRIMVIDHGIFSFVDQKHNTWPIVLVTNPKHARYVMPDREPLQLVPESTHIRILAFSDTDIKSVLISFDKITWIKCRNVKGPLYVTEWSPNLYLNGIYTLHVSVVDDLGREANVEHPFSLDGSLVRFGITSRVLLMLDAGSVFQAVFCTLLLLNVVPLILFRIQKQAPKYRRQFGRQTLRRIWLLSKVDRIFYPVMLYALYLPIGPWAIGELIDGYIGVIFAWGIVIKDAFIPEPFTYMYGSVQLMFVQLPLIFVLAYSLENHLFGQNLFGVRRLTRHLPYVLLLTVQMILAYFFWLEYGGLAFILGPLRTWCIVLNTLIWYKTLTLPPDICRKLTAYINEAPP